MKTLISQAIEERRQLRTVFEGKRRITVEPLALGQTPTGQDALLCRQVMPSSPPGADWRIYHLDQFSTMHMLDDTFDFPAADRHILAHRLANITAMV